MGGIFQLIFKVIGLFLKTLFWIISASIRLAVFSVVYSLYITLGMILPTPFLLLFSFKGLIKKWKDFGPNSMNIFYGFFPEIKRLFTKSKNKRKKQILKEYTFPANTELIEEDSSKNKSEKKICKSCETPYSEKMKEILKKGEKLLYCEYCGAEI